VSSLLSNSNIKLSDEIETIRKIERFVEGGRSQIAVVSDFGRTITTGASLSTHAIVQKSISCPKFQKESKENYDSVYPIKRDPSIPLSTKIPLMREWYNKTHALMASVGITRTMVKDVIAQRSGEDFDPGNGGIRIREGAVGEMECERGARGGRSKVTTGERYNTKKSGDLPLVTLLLTFSPLAALRFAHRRIPQLAGGRKAQDPGFFGWTVGRCRGRSRALSRCPSSLPFRRGQCDGLV
jgi:hypothetical protein